MQNIEVELKFPVLNPKEAVKRLDAVGKREGEWRQVDTYFNHPQRDFLAAQLVVEWLRIRKTDKGASITYKHWHNTTKRDAVSCDEYETTISDAASATKILENLGFIPLITVDNTRATWQFKDVEIAVDSVKDIGVFIELESKGAFTSIEEAKHHLFAIVKELDLELGKQDLKGYPHLLLEKKGYKLA